MKAPTSNSQAPEKPQAASSKKHCSNRRVVWNLKFGICLVLDAWMLVLFFP
jgi:hypothetical protein